MKYFLLIISLTILFSFECLSLPLMDSVKTKSDFNLVGDVVSFKDKVYTAKEIEGRIENKSLISTDEYKVINDTVFLLSSKMSGSTTNYFYNELNNLTEITTISSKDGSFAGRHIFCYDTNSMPILELVYNSQSKLQDSIVLKVNNIMKTKYAIAYSPKSGRKLYSIKTNYNNNGCIYEKTKIMPESTIQFSYKYDEKTNNLIEESWFLNNELVQKITFDYNSLNKLAKRTEYDETLTPRHQEEFLYDPMSGSVIEMKNTKHTTKYEYNFDNAGNWIVRYEFFDSVPVKVTERQIEYKK